MLAKIAHSYAFAKCGIDTFEPMLLDLILGRAENAPYLVGGDASGLLPDQPGVLHDIYPVVCKLEPSDEEYLLIAIRLFAFWNMPRYHVVVGKKLKELRLPKLEPSTSHVSDFAEEARRQSRQVAESEHEAEDQAFVDSISDIKF